MYKCNVSLKRCPVFTVSKIACKLKGDVIVRKATTLRLPAVETHEKAMQFAGRININVCAAFSDRLCSMQYSSWYFHN